MHISHARTLWTACILGIAAIALIAVGPGRRWIGQAAKVGWRPERSAGVYPMPDGWPRCQKPASHCPRAAAKSCANRCDCEMLAAASSTPLA